MIKLVLFDGRGAGERPSPADPPTAGQIDEFFLGEHNPLLVRVPPGVWHGWKCVSAEEAYIVNAPTEVYKYDEPDQDELPHDTPRDPLRLGREAAARGAGARRSAA